LSSFWFILKQQSTIKISSPLFSIFSLVAILVGNRDQRTQIHWASVVRPLTFHILINSPEATGSIWTKLWWNGPWMAPFQICVRWSIYCESTFLCGYQFSWICKFVFFVFIPKIKFVDFIFST
jgi:hypothetical protein